MNKFSSRIWGYFGLT
uniref:Uncharacterized protein n=1 Tax=Rhizophora mucronata TaxID=61149 RepID=A0A2P2IQD2_RHIMU